MRIYSRQDFLKLPLGTFFAKGIQWVMDGFCVKDETWCDDNGNPIDFLYINLVSIDSFNSEELVDREDEMLAKGTSYPLCEHIYRDGCFDNTEIFLVFEKEDLVKIKMYIEEALG